MICKFCGYPVHESTANNHGIGICIPKPEAARDPVNYRYDILYAPFIRMMALIGGYGAQKYGDFDWQKSRLSGQKGPMNHMMNHMTSYMSCNFYDHTEVGADKKIHLAAIAFNAMMEFWYQENLDQQNPEMS